MIVVADFPRISIVIPNYNGDAYLERTLDSVLDQGYPNLEVIVVDGGSTDRSVEIIRRYESKLAYWVSEKDSGQSNAINKGFARATGEIVNWLCSDDRLLPALLAEVGRRFAQDPSLDVLVGGCTMEYLDDPQRSYASPMDLDAIRLIPCTNPIRQPSCFYRRKLLRPTPLDESYHYAMDLELWAYFVTKKVHWGATDVMLSEFLHTGLNKTMTGGKKIIREFDRIYRAYTREFLPMCSVTRYILHPLDRRVAAHGTRGMGKVAGFFYWFAWHTFGRIYGFDRLAAQLMSYRSFDPPPRRWTPEKSSRLLNFHGHGKPEVFGGGRRRVRAGDRHHTARMVGEPAGDVLVRAALADGGIEGEPAVRGQIDFHPGVSRGPAGGGGRAIQIARRKTAPPSQDNGSPPSSASRCPGRSLWFFRGFARAIACLAPGGGCSESFCTA